MSDGFASKVSDSTYSLYDLCVSVVVFTKKSLTTETPRHRARFLLDLEDIKHLVPPQRKHLALGVVIALDDLIPLVDRELKKIAHHYMRLEKPGHILQTTALVNEALIKLIRENVRLENRKHFYALIAKRMRQILVDYARKGAQAEQIEWDESVRADERSEEILALDRALKNSPRLMNASQRSSNVVSSSA